MTPLRPTMRSLVVAELRAELAELDARRTRILDELEYQRSRDAFAAVVVAGFAANANPDQGVTSVEVRRAYDLFDFAQGLTNKREPVAP